MHVSNSIARITGALLLFGCLPYPSIAKQSYSIKAPTGVKATITGKTIRLSWQPVSHAIGYRVYCSPGISGVMKLVGKTVKASYGSASAGIAAPQHYAVTTVGPDGSESILSKLVCAISLRRPWGVAVTRTGIVLVRDYSYSQTIALDSAGNTLALLKTPGCNFEGSRDISLDNSGRLLNAICATDISSNSGFVVLDNNLKVALSVCGPSGSENGRFKDPMGISANSAGHIFVADTGNNRVQEFDNEGNYVQIIGAGDLRLPMKTAFDRQNRLYVADFGSNNIIIFEPQADGSYKMIKKLPGVKEPVSVAVDERGRIFVISHRFGAVHMLMPDGKDVWQWKGPKNNPLSGPRGMAFDKSGHLIIVDEARQRVVSVKLP